MVFSELFNFGVVGFYQLFNGGFLFGLFGFNSSFPFFRGFAL